MTVSITPLTAIIVMSILWLISNWILSFFMTVDNVIAWMLFVPSLVIGVIINYLVEKNDNDDCSGGGM